MTREESDLGLLKLMADGAQPYADVAFRVFYDRHKSYHWKVCSNVASALHGECWIEDIHQDTFARAYQKAGTFKLPEGTPDGEMTQRVRAWLGRIATRLLQKKLTRFGGEQTRDDQGWEVLANETGLASVRETNEASPTREQELIEHAIESLSEREAHVLRITYQFHRVGERFQRLPNQITQQLADALATTPENLRKIRERALEKVNQYIRERRAD